MVVHDPVRERILAEPVFHLEQEALAKVAGADAHRIEALDRPEHALDVRHRHVDRGGDLLDRAGQIAVLVDVADDLLADPHVPVPVAVVLIELRQKMVPEIDRRLPDLLGHLFGALTGGTGAVARIETVEQDLLPVDLLLLFLRLLLGLGLVGELLFRLGHLEEGILHEFLFEVLFELEEGQVEEIHRLVQARIHPHFLPLGEVELLSKRHAGTRPRRGGS